MKKRITRPDGTVEEVEGTAEELAELERAATKKSPKKESKAPSRRVLTDEIQRLKNENEELKKKLADSNAATWQRIMDEIQRQPKLPEPFIPTNPMPWIEPWQDQPYKTIPRYPWDQIWYGVDRTITCDNTQTFSSKLES